MNTPLDLDAIWHITSSNFSSAVFTLLEMFSSFVRSNTGVHVSGILTSYDASMSTPLSLSILSATWVMAPFLVP